MPASTHKSSKSVDMLNHSMKNLKVGTSRKFKKNKKFCIKIEVCEDVKDIAICNVCKKPGHLYCQTFY